jgi:hypothetical protein
VHSAFAGFSHLACKYSGKGEATWTNRSSRWHVKEQGEATLRDQSDTRQRTEILLGARQAAGFAANRVL